MQVLTQRLKRVSLLTLKKNPRQNPSQKPKRSQKTLLFRDFNTTRYISSAALSSSRLIPAEIPEDTED